MFSHLTLFNELPVGSQFRFETPDTGKVFLKINEHSARIGGQVQTINPGVLIFPLPNPIVYAALTTRQGDKWTAYNLGDGWYLTPDGGIGLENSHFNSLEDVINHLGA